ncbi:MAG TPA: S9 family peptidase [Pyrinomonadaceae bacterium]|nr:S9 family peptidase [Pyrinomonadaceae bacterium]
MAQTTQNTLTPPVARKIPKEATTNGDKRVDNYFWLREKTNPEVIKYLEAENAYAEAFMKPSEALQQTLYKEMVGHLKETDVNVPYRDGNYFYFSRTEKGKQYPIYCRKRESLSAPEEVTLDLNELAKGHKYLGLGAYTVSDDGNLLAYTTDTTGYRQYTLQVKDLRTGQLSPEKIERVGQVSWAGDNRTLFYTTEDAVTKRRDKFYRHTVGTEKSELLFDEKDELYDVESYRSRDKAYVFLVSESKLTSEVRYISTAQPAGELMLIAPRQNEHKYFADHRDGLFYIRTNEGGKNYRVVTAPAADPKKKNWKELIAHRPSVKLNDIDLFANHLVISEREKGLEQLEIVDLRPNGKTHRVEFPEPVYSTALSNNREFNTNTLRFNYQSLVTPSSVFDYDMNTKERKLLKQTEVPGYNAALYTSERAFATASDGTRIPLSIVYKKGLKMDGKNPLLLYGYGSYGISMSPTFSLTRLSMLDRGVIYVIAHIRGGGEMGEDWREQGRMMFKKNTFTDFISSAEYLIKERYTNNQRLVIQGGSAGGLLVGAVSNMRPDLFKAVVAQVPFVDVINTMLDASLPLTTSEYLEWGNPNEPKAYEYIKSYSPYDQIKPQSYPAMLIKVSLNDSQVPYWEGAKFAAKLRATKTDNNPVLLKTNMGAGHGGSSGRYDALKEVAFDYAFILTQMGINQ